MVKKNTVLGAINVALNNAGYGTVGPLEGTSGENLHRIIDTNVIGVNTLAKAFHPHFRENKAGVFITASSIGGLTAYPFFYHVTKWPIEGWTESLAFEMNRLGSQNGLIDSHQI